MRNKKFKLITLLLLGFGSMGLQAQTFETFTDSRDGKVYKTVKIGEQVWMAENLAYKPDSGIYRAYDDDDSKIAVYGYLYDWKTALNVCPTGWHLPSDVEWAKLTDYNGGVSVAGGRLKQNGTTHWELPNKGAINNSGFTALPGGKKRSTGMFFDIGYTGNWWSATESSKYEAWYRNMNYNYSDVFREYDDKICGFSVRCLKD